MYAWDVSILRALSILSVAFEVEVLSSPDCTPLSTTSHTSTLMISLVSSRVNSKRVDEFNKQAATRQIAANPMSQSVDDGVGVG